MALREGLKASALILPLILLLIWLFQDALRGGRHSESHEIEEILKNTPPR